MATKYVTLKDSNGDTLYPQAVASIISANSIGTTELADGAVTPAKLARGVLSLGYYGTSIVSVTSSTYSALASGSITTHGGDLYINGYVYGAKNGGGTVGLLVKIDNDTPIRVSMHNLQGNAPLTCSYLVTGLAAGTHTVSYGVAIQSGSGNSYDVSAYCEDRVTFIEI